MEEETNETATEMDMNTQIELLWVNLTASVERNANISKEIDKFFLIVMAVVIFFMQCGFAFLEAGSVRYVNLYLSLEWMEGGLIFRQITENFHTKLSILC